MTNPILPDRYKHPLRYVDPAERKVYRKKALKKAFFWIGIGIISVILTIILTATGFNFESGRRDSIGTALTLGMTLAPLYGILQLITLRNRMTDLARHKLYADRTQQYRAIHEKYQKDLERRKSQFLKIFTFSLAGSLIFISIIVAIYFVFFYHIKPL